MNLLDTSITWVGEPYYDNNYDMWRVPIRYNEPYVYPPQENESERWFMNKEDALKVNVGDTIQV